MKNKFDLAIIGGGIVGVATAYKLQLKYPQKTIVLIEKEDMLAAHQTGNNSGVIHSGIYYKPGSFKAKNCIQGRKEIVEFAEKYGIAYDVCGKVIVATDEKELPQLERIYQIGLTNEIEGIRKINTDEIREIEPHCEGIAGIHVPCTGIIDFKGVTRKLAELIVKQQPLSEIHLGEEFLSIERMGEQSNITTSKGNYEVNKVIFCGGLQADRLARKDGIKLKEKVVPFRGDYYELTEEARHKVKHLIYPVPDPEFPFLGVHFTRMVNGEIECGPNAVFSFKREGYGKTNFSFRDTWDALTYKGTWKLFLGNMSYGIMEYRRAFSKRLFHKTLQRLIPSLTMEDLKPARSGVRAMLLNEKGDTRDDFRIEYTNNSIHVLNAPSPAATAALAIGGEVVKMAETHFKF